MRGLRTIAAVVMLSAAAWGQSLVFDGSKYLSTPDSADFDWTTENEFSVSFWAKPDIVSDINKLSGFVQKGYYESDAGFEILLNRNAPVLGGGIGSVGFIVNNEDLYSDTVLVAGEWAHIACVKDAANHYIYINGILDANRATTAFQTNSLALEIGRRNPSAALPDTFDGSIADPVRIYSYALTANEVAALYLDKAAYLNYTVFTNTYASLPTPDWPLANIGGTNVLTEIPMRPSPLLPINAAVTNTWTTYDGQHTITPVNGPTVGE